MTYRPRFGTANTLVVGTAVRLDGSRAPFQVVVDVVEIPQPGDKQWWLKVLYLHGGDSDWRPPNAAFEIRVEGPDCQTGVEYGPAPDPDPVGWGQVYSERGNPEWEEIAEEVWNLYLNESCYCHMDHGNPCRCGANSWAENWLRDLLGDDWHARMRLHTKGEN